MKRLVFLFLVLFLLSAHSVVRSQEPEYTMEFSLLPIRMSVNDLSSLLSKINRFVLVTKAALPHSADRTINELALSDDVHRFQVSNDFSAHTLKSAPSTSLSASYTYRGLDSEPISRVSIELNEYNRKISVSGRSEEQVEALAQLMRSEMQAYETYWGGIQIRFLGFLAFFIAFAGLMYFRHPIAKAGVLLFSGTWLFCFLFVTSLTPGAAIYKSSPSFFVRFAPEISFASLVAGVVGVLLTIFLRREGKVEGAISDSPE